LVCGFGDVSCEDFIELRDLLLEDAKNFLAPESWPDLASNSRR
jgi:hypothetical protein